MAHDGVDGADLYKTDPDFAEQARHLLSAMPPAE
jgi:hypothetical protein